MFRNATILLVALLFLNASSSLAQRLQAPLPLPLPIPLPLDGTPEERAACGPDVDQYCGHAVPDTFRVLACLQANRPRISSACQAVLASHGQ